MITLQESYKMNERIKEIMMRGDAVDSAFDVLNVMARSDIEDHGSVMLYAIQWATEKGRREATAEIQAAIANL